MAQKVHTSDGIVLSKYELGEASVSVLVLTAKYGLVRLRAQSARRTEGKLRYALEPMMLGSYSFVRGTQSNRLVGAQAQSVLLNMEAAAARRAAGQIGKLLLRLLAGEVEDEAVFEAVRDGFLYMSACAPEDIPDVECLLVLSVLSKLGYLPEDTTLLQFAHAPVSTDTLSQMRTLRPQAVRAINRVLSLSGL